jgi:hypothetical protein
MIHEADYDRAFAAFRALGYDEFHKSELYAKLKAVRTQGLDVDLMFVNRATFDYVQQHARDVTVYGVPFRVPRPEDIIAMKLHACKQGGFRREIKDLIDIVGIVESQGIDVNAQPFKDLCMKFGDQGLYDDILKAVRRK